MTIKIELSLEKDIKNLDEFFSDVKFKAITLATRQALNRTARDVKVSAVKELRKRQKLKLKEVNQRVKQQKARGSNIATLESSIEFSGIPLPLILFIVGRKEPIKHTRPNRSRKSRKFELRKGNKKSKPGLFVEKAKRGRLRYQVFRRRGPNDKSKGFVKQSAPSIAHFLQSKRNILTKIENNGIAIMQQEFDRAIKLQLDKLK